MSNQSAGAPPPSGYVSILSKAQTSDGKTLAIAPSKFEPQAVSVDVYVEGSDAQLWERRPFSDGSYALINKASYLCIYQEGEGNLSPLILMPAQFLSDPHAHWRDDNVAGDYNAINSLTDWEQKINIPGDGPYNPGQPLVTYTWSNGAPNELWKQVAATVPLYTLQSIGFDTASARIQRQQPIGVSQPIEFTNTAYGEVPAPISTDVPANTDYGFAPDAGQQTLQAAYNGERPQLDASGNIQMPAGDWQYMPAAVAAGTVHFSTTVQVPARAVTAYYVMQDQNQITLPYVASFVAPGGGSPFEVKGTYTATCPGNCFIQQGPSSPV